MTAPRSGRRSGVIAAVGGLAAAVGLGLIGWASWEAFSQPVPPYRYEPVASPPATPPHTEKMLLPEDMPVQWYEVVAADGNTIASMQVGKSADLGPVLLEWRGTGDPVITETASLRELLALAQAVREHIPAEARVLAWWDTSRQLQALAGVEAIFDQHLGTPLFVPAAWQGSADAVVEVEAEFWRSALDRDAASGRFLAFVDALAAKPAEGSAALRQLAKGNQTFLVLHLVDALKVGLMRPERFPLRYRDFARSGDIHGLIRLVKSWVEAEGLGGYAVHPLPGDRIRIYALPEEAATGTLIGRLLPFSTSKALKVDGLTLVYQVGGYWVYRIDGVAAADGQEEQKG